MMKKFILLLASTLVLYLVLSSLNPLDNRMFDFHDETQVGRITSFVGNLKALNIPPRLAPEYSFNLGFPVFNFYAPAAYWITGIIALIGLHPIIAVKLSFMFTVLGGFYGMYYLLSRFFKFYPSLLGAAVYATSTYFATEIVIRGNLAESWFLAFFPLGLGLFIQHSRKPTLLTHIFSTITLALLFTSHNMLSLFAIPITIVIALILPRKKQSFFTILLALLINSYFLVPALLEGSFIQATSIAKNFTYTEHFLCPWQLWTSMGWQFGGSLPGCDADLMSFKLGKPHVILGVLGGMLFLIRSYIRRKKLSTNDYIFTFIFLITSGSLFLTLYQSQFIWSAFEPIMSLFQFPWRFLVFGMFGTAFFAGYAFEHIKIPFKKVAVLGIVIMLFVIGRKYFVKPLHSFKDYNERYNSEKYINQHLAYNMREYLAVGVDYETWHYYNPLEVESRPINFDYTEPVSTDIDYTTNVNSSFYKKITAQNDGQVLANIHYFPFWHITVNGEAYEHEELDKLARPAINVKANDVVEISYRQTATEQIANLLTIIGFIALAYSGYRFYPRSQKKS